MGIFRKAFDQHNNYNPRIEDLIRRFKEIGDEPLANFVEEMAQKGYDFQQIRDMASSVMSFMR